MDSFIIKGPSRLEGTVAISGAKNAVLPLMAASILTDGTCRMDNVPNLRDTRTMMKLLEILGASYEFKDGTVTVGLRYMLWGHSWLGTDMLRFRCLGDVPGAQGL